MSVGTKNETTSRTIFKATTHRHARCLRNETIRYNWGGRVFTHACSFHVINDRIAGAK